MPTVPTLDSSGYRPLVLDEIRDNLRERVEGSPQFGVGVSTGPSSVLGQVLDVFAEELSGIYDVSLAVYDQFAIDNSEGLQLDNLGGVRGVYREPAAKSTGQITASGTPTTVIPTGSEVRVPNAGRFVTTEDATIGGGGTVDIDVESVEYGPIEAAVGAITEIVTAIPGWTSVTNAEEVQLGQTVEPDDRYRLRIKRSGAIGGTGTDPAIRSRLEALTIVDFAAAISNRTIYTDPVTGQLGNSVAVYVWPVLTAAADKELIAQTIWGDAGLSAGIMAWGSEQYTVTDSQGYSQSVAFSFATEQEIYFSAIVSQATSALPSNAGDLIKAAIVSYFAANQGLGTDVLPVPILCAIFSAVPGLEVIELRLKIGSAPGPSDTAPIEIGATEIATTEAAHIGVTLP